MESTLWTRQILHNSSWISGVLQVVEKIKMSLIEIRNHTMWMSKLGEASSIGWLVACSLAHKIKKLNFQWDRVEGWVACKSSHKILKWVGSRAHPKASMSQLVQ